MENENKNQQIQETKGTAVEALPMVQRAYEAAEKIRAENDRLEKNIAELRELKAIEVLGGRSDAGIQPQQPKEETPQEYAKRILAGGK